MKHGLAWEENMTIEQYKHLPVEDDFSSEANR
jgi:hypothetical protein